MTEQNPETITIATRESPLALWQARFIRQCLQQRWPGLPVELLGMTTSGDQILDSPLSKVGGKGLFVKELETALLDGRADIAVHSTKDMPATLPAGLELFIAGERADPRDALVLPVTGGEIAAGKTGHIDNTGKKGLDVLAPGAVVGTSSLRRLCQLKHARPDLDCRDLRGNVNTRLAKLDAGQYDAIVLAAAGLQRLGLARRISALLPVEQLLPAVSQGALAIEYRAGDESSWRRFVELREPATTLCVAAERALNHRLDGGCQVPIAAYAELDGGVMLLRARVGSPDGKRLLSEESSIYLDMKNQAAPSTGAWPAQAKAAGLGVLVAEQLLAAGAGELLATICEPHG